MSIGIICEFNPFHYGHKYLIDQVQKFNLPVICAMSGQFVQRREPACYDMYSRSSTALKHGADMVIMLPTKFAISSAQNFARGGVLTLQKAGITHLAFGAETDDLTILKEIAEIKTSKEIDNAIKENLNIGLSYPTALNDALCSKNKDFEKILATPNNILAIEYLCALKNTNIIPIAIKRLGNYNDTTLTGKYASATAIRSNLLKGNLEGLDLFMPTETINVPSVDYMLYDKLCLFALRKIPIDELHDIPDVENGLEYSLKRACDNCTSIQDILQQVKSRRYTFSRLKRILLYVLLSAKKQVMSDITNVKTRVLGIKSTKKHLLSNLDSSCIISRNSCASEDFKNDPSVILDALSCNIYSLLTNTQSGSYSAKPMIVF